MAHKLLQERAKLFQKYSEIQTDEFDKVEFCFSLFYEGEGIDDYYADPQNSYIPYIPQELIIQLNVHLNKNQTFSIHCGPTSLIRISTAIQALCNKYDLGQSIRFGSYTMCFDTISYYDRSPIIFSIFDKNEDIVFDAILPTKYWLITDIYEKLIKFIQDNESNYELRDLISDAFEQNSEYRYFKGSSFDFFLSRIKSPFIEFKLKNNRFLYLEQIKE